MFLKFGFDLFFSYFCENLSFMNSNIYLLRGKIETNPEVIADIDWRKETNGFDETMLDELVMSIDDDELNELVRESIANQWYLATNNASWPIADCDFDLTKMYYDGYGRLDRGYRYNTEKDDLDYINSIEEHLGTSNEKRIKKRELEKTNNLLQKKALELARKKKSAIQPTEPQQVFGEDKGMNDKVVALTLELHKKQEAIESLKQELEELRKCHNDLKEEYDSLQNKSVPESGNRRMTDCENEEIIKQARNDGMRELVEQLIVYAENENQEAAREIKFALMAKMVNCIITPETLTPELKERLDNLGRKKENNMIFYNSVGAVVANASQVSFPNNKE